MLMLPYLLDPPGLLLAQLSTSHSEAKRAVIVCQTLRRLPGANEIYPAISHMGHGRRCLPLVGGERAQRERGGRATLLSGNGKFCNRLIRVLDGRLQGLRSLLSRALAFGVRESLPVCSDGFPGQMGNQPPVISSTNRIKDAQQARGDQQIIFARLPLGPWLIGSAHQKRQIQTFLVLVHHLSTFVAAGESKDPCCEECSTHDPGAPSRICALYSHWVGVRRCSAAGRVAPLERAGYSCLPASSVPWTGIRQDWRHLTPPIPLLLAGR